MKNIFLLLLAFSLGAMRVTAAWTPPATSIVGANSGTISSSVVAQSDPMGYNRPTVIFLWLQDPAGVWHNLGSGYAQAGLTATASGSYTFDSPGTYVWQANYGIAFNSAPPPAGSTANGPTTTNVAKFDQTPVSISPTNPIVGVGSTVTFTANGGGVGGYIWSGAASGTGQSINVTFNYVGTTNVYVQSPGDASYNPSNQPGSTITIQKLSQTIVYNTAPPSSVTFGDSIDLNAISECPDGVSYAQVGGTGSAQISFKTVTFDNAGTVIIRASQAGNDSYFPATDVDRTITVNSKAATFSLSPTSFGFDGTLHAPTIVPNPSGATFVTGGTLSATNVNSYVATAAANGNFTGSNSNLAWTITQASQPLLTVTGPSFMNYGDSPQATADGGAGNGSLIWSLGSGSTAAAAAISGTGTVTSSSTGTVIINVHKNGDGNYLSGSPSSDFPVTVAQRPITVTLAGSKSYDGTTSSTGAFASVPPGSLASGDAITYAYNNTSSAAVGNYSGLVTATIKNGSNVRSSNYAITYTGIYSIGSSDITAATLISPTYNLTSQLPTLSSVTPAGASVTIAATSQTNVGSYTATVSGTNGYGGTLTNVPWSIQKANQTLPVINSPASMVYGNAYTASASLSGNGTSVVTWLPGSASTPAGATITASGGAVAVTGSGTAKIMAKRVGDANYADSNWTADFPITVSTRPITVTLGGSKLSNGNTTPTGATATLNGTLAPGDLIGYNFANTSSSAANYYTGLVTATITNAAAPTTRTTSYAITYDGRYQIQSQQNPQATVTVSGPATMVYGNTPTATVAAGSGSGTGAIDWLTGTTGASPAPSPAIVHTTGVVSSAGTGNVWIKARRLADTNYLDSNWSADFTIPVTARPLTVTLAGSKIYDGTTTGTGATLTVTSGSLAPGDVLATYTSPAAGAAAYPLSTVTINNAAVPTTRTGNYSLTYAGSYTINKATITAASISPLTYNGTSQHPSALSASTPSGATAAISATAGQTNASTYTTGTVSGSGNFQGVLSGVSWTIIPATPTGTFASRTLGTTSPSGYLVVSGQLNASFSGPAGAPAPSGEKSYALAPGTPNGTVGMAVTAGTVLPVGVYKVRATIAANGNYATAPVDSLWTVTDDVDGDGVPGYIETQIGTDPNVANAAETSPSNPTGLQIQRPNL